MGKGIEYVNEKINSNQLDIYKDPKKDITYNDIYYKLSSSSEQELSNLYNITKRLINYKYKDKRSNSKYNHELHNLFLNLQNNQSDTNYQLLAKFLF